MKNQESKHSLHILFIIGTLTLAVCRVIEYRLDITAPWMEALCGFAQGFIICGALLTAFAPQLKNSKLRQWKLRLIGKEPK